MKITREMLIEECCCYTETPGKLERYVPVDGITPLQVCDADVSVDDKLWCLVRKYGDYQPLTDRQYRLLACKWAREACELAGWDDARSLRAIDVAEKYADGLASKDDLEEARSVAWEVEVWAAAAWEPATQAASCSAARSAASSAAWSAAWSAMGAAMGAALGAAAALGVAAPYARAEAHSRHIADIRAVLTGDLFAEGKS